VQGDCADAVQSDCVDAVACFPALWVLVLHYSHLFILWTRILFIFQLEIDWRQIPYSRLYYRNSVLLVHILVRKNHYRFVVVTGFRANRPGNKASPIYVGIRPYPRFWCTSCHLP